jgi:hypothetical protein
MDRIDRAALTATVPLITIAFALDEDFTTFDFQHQHTMIGMRHQKINFAHRARTLTDPANTMEAHPGIGQISKSLIQIQLRIAGSRAARSPAIDLALIETLEITDINAVCVPVDLHLTDLRDAEYILHAVFVVPFLADETRFVEVGIAPRYTVHDRKLLPAGLIQVCFGELETLCQLAQNLSACTRLTIPQRFKERE